MGYLNDEIERVKAAAIREDQARWERFPFDPAKDCCPSCMYGDEYSAFVDKQQRRVAWLRVLLTKRSSDEDCRIINAIDAGVWP